MSKQQTREEAWQYFVGLLESNNLSAVKELMKAVEETHAKESWMVESLIDFYMSNDSQRALELIASSREHDKVICKKLHEYFEEPSRRRATLWLLIHIISKQPPWLHKLTRETIFSDCIRCMKIDTDAPALMYAMHAIAMLMPVTPEGIAASLKDILEAFMRVVAFAYISGRGTMPEVYQLNLQVGVYSLFVRLYGMYPWSLLACLQQHYSKSEHRQLYRDAIEPMLDRVRLHPLLITASTREKELSRERWRSKEAHDIVADCAALAVDAMEGITRDRSYVLSTAVMTGRPTSPPQTTAATLVATMSSAKPSSPRIVRNALFQVQSTSSMEPAVDSLIALAASSSFFSPSERCGLVTPTSQSHSTTPIYRVGRSVGGEDDTSISVIRSGGGPGPQQAGSTNLGSSSGTPLVVRRGTPKVVTTPKDAPTPVLIAMDGLGSSHNSRHNSGGQSKESGIAPLTLTSVDENGSGSRGGPVPPSPHRKEFTCEPPADALKAPAFHLASNDGVTNAEAPTAPLSVIKAATADECSLSVKSLPQLLEKLSDSASLAGSELDDSIDEEVSSINQPSGFVSASSVVPTVESVAALVKTVNRIRFNSTTVPDVEPSGSNSSNSSHRARPKSCPITPTADTVAVPAAVGKALDDGSVGCNRQQRALVSSPATAFKPSSIANDEKGLNTSLHVTPGVCVAADVSIRTLPGTSSGMVSSHHENVLAPQILPADPAHWRYQAADAAARCSSLFVDATDGNLSHSARGLSCPSPSELLDEHLRQGDMVHAKLRSRMALADQMSTRWTHFGGSPPADEVAILQGQLMMMHTQLMYERHKREQHAMRNRRLLREITRAVTLQEQNEALNRQVQDFEVDIFNLNTTLSLQKEELKQQKCALAASESQRTQQLLQKAKQVEELEYAHKDLLHCFDAQHAELSCVKSELATARCRLQQVEQDLQMAGEQMERVTALEDETATLKKELLLMGEVQIKYDERLAALACQGHRSQGGFAPAVEGSSDVHSKLIADIDRLNKMLSRRADDVNSVRMEMESLQQALHQKESMITDLKKMMEQLKLVHCAQMKAVEDKYAMLRAACQAMEQQSVELHAQIARLTTPLLRTATGSQQQLQQQQV